MTYPDDAELLRRNRVSDQQDQVPPSAVEQFEPSGLPPLPAVLTTRYFRETGLRPDITQPGAWDLTGETRDGEHRSTFEDGPLDDTAKRALARAYPDVAIWQARPARIDETYRDSRNCARRVAALYGIPRRSAEAILTIAATPELGWRYAHGRFEVTCDDDDQSWRVRSVDHQPGKVAAHPDRRLTHVPMCCTACGEPVTEHRPGVWAHTTKDAALGCPRAGGIIRARVDNAIEAASHPID